MIYRANATTGKLPYIERARDLVVGVKVRLRLLQDMRHISVKQYAAFAQQVELLSKQLSAWHDYARRQDERVKKNINKKDINKRIPLPTQNRIRPAFRIAKTCERVPDKFSNPLSV